MAIFFELKMIKKTIQKFAHDNGMLSDMTAISAPIPSKKELSKYYMTFMLFYSSPSQVGGRENPEISEPYAFIKVNANDLSIVDLKNNEISDNRELAYSYNMEIITQEKLFQIRNLYQDLIIKVFSLYWEGNSLSKSDLKDIFDYTEFNQVLLEYPLLNEYKKINPLFFEWLKKKSNIST